MKYPFDKDIEPPIEVKQLDKEPKKVKMRRLLKNKPHTWWNGTDSKYKPADLDHVIASEQLMFKRFDTADIDVRGWPEYETVSKQTEWIKDRNLLFR